MMTKLMICGSRHTTPAMLNETVRIIKELVGRSKVEILVGDADGVDKLVVQGCINYSMPFKVYYVERIGPRNPNNEHLPVASVAVKATGTNKQTFIQRDDVMLNDCDIMVGIWDGKSKGTKRNYDQAVRLGKQAWLMQDVHDKMMCFGGEQLI